MIFDGDHALFKILSSPEGQRTDNPTLRRIMETVSGSNQTIFLTQLI